MVRLRSDFELAGDEWSGEPDDADDAGNPAHDGCSGCGRTVPGSYQVLDGLVDAVDGPVCEGPGPFPRPCPAGLRMPVGGR